MGASRVEQFEQIRRDRAQEELSIRELARRHGVHRRTVRQALESAVPPPKQAPESRPAPKLGPYRAVIDKWLAEDLKAPRKQRHTARRVWQRLTEEHGAEVSERQVWPPSGASSARSRPACRWSPRPAWKPRSIGARRG